MIKSRQLGGLVSQIHIAVIEKDHLWEEGDSVDSYEGKNLFFLLDDDLVKTIKATGEERKFQLYDDDDILYYEGVLRDDPECIVQDLVLEWAMADSGAVTLKVWKEGEWIQEIA